MIVEHRKSEFAATLIVATLVAASWTLALSDPYVARSDGESENYRLVVRNMSAVFSAFGLGGQQGEMLAVQTADFGTLGAMTTVATVGIDAAPADTLAARHRLSEECAFRLRPPRTAHTEGMQWTARPLPAQSTLPELGDDFERSM
jgi:hypothetical protein